MPDRATGEAVAFASPAWVDGWVAQVNSDATIGRLGKYFNGRMCIQFDTDMYILCVSRGRIIDVLHNPLWDRPYDFKIAATTDVWRRSAEAVPRPFFQDIFGMMWNHGMTLEGNVVCAMQNIRVVKLMLAAMKLVNAEV